MQYDPGSGTTAGLIQGQSPDSLDELVMSQALGLLKIDYIYQYEMFGGKAIRGGLVIDFLLLIPPQPIPLFINGRYWHTGEHAGEQELQLAELEARTAGEFATPVIIWDDEFNTIGDAVGLLRARIL